jgi:glutamine phosphoribosylpyrophosphate amidotransferase
MCGIGGIILKTPGGNRRTGEIAYRILESITRRGRDSVGIALWQPNGLGLLHVGINYERPGLGPRVVEHLKRVGRDVEAEDGGGFVRATGRFADDDDALIAGLEAIDPSVSVGAVGSHVEVLKALGAVGNLERSFHLTDYAGRVAIGLTRNATESRVDFAHAQPLGVRGARDIAIMHNGHITNYLRLRERYRRKGHVLTTTNDSEVVGIVIADRMAKGESFEEALRFTQSEIDGSMTYVVVTDRAVGLVKDQWAYKPMVVAETEAFVALASDGEAIANGLGRDVSFREPGAGEVIVWPL